MRISNHQPLSAKLRIIRAIRHKAVQLDDDSYRAILQRAAGVSSSTQITSLTKANAVIAEFHRLGLGNAPSRKPLTPTQKKIWSLWQQLADAKLVQNRTMRGLMGWVKRQAGVDALDFLNHHQEKTLIESMKFWLDRGHEQEGGAHA